MGRCNCPLVENESQFQGVTNWTKIHGNHSFKFGADIRSASNLRVPSDANRTGVLTFSHLNTSGGMGDTDRIGGLDLATFLLGDVTNMQRFVSSSLNASEHQWRYFFYGQDTWRITPKLTLNYGLRWELYMPESVNAKGNGGFANPQQGIIRVAGYGPYNLSANINNDWNAFAPRFGLAYSMNEKTVIRTGFGVSYDIGVFGSNFGHAVTQNLPVLANQTLTASVFNSAASDNYITAFNLGTGPIAQAAITIPSNGQLPLGGPTGSVQPRMRPTTQTLPSVATWNLAIQRQLTNSMTLDIAYVGVEGRHGFVGDGSAYNLNPVNIQNYTLTQAGIIPQTARQYYNNMFSYPGYTNSSGGVLTCCSGSVMGNYFGNNANSNYNALQVKVNQQMRNGLQFIAHYTWSRALNYNDGPFAYFAINPHVVYGPDDQNRPQVFVFNAVYQLPFGKGKQFGGSAGKAENMIIGGWQVTGTPNWSSGPAVHAKLHRMQYDERHRRLHTQQGESCQLADEWRVVQSASPTPQPTSRRQPLGNAWLEPTCGTLGNAGNVLVRAAVVSRRTFRS